ncbi:MAG: hybrid sensor histidine kinase/response regulator [Methylococcaceae bacterium]
MQQSDDLILTFIEEAREHLPLIEANLLALEHKANDPALLNEVFRSVHTIKGGAGFFGLSNISLLAHSMENVLSLARTNKILLDNNHIDALLASKDRLVRMIDDSENSNNIAIDSYCQQLSALIDNSSNALAKEDNSDLVLVDNMQNQPKITIEINPPSSPEKEELEEYYQDDLLASFIEEAKECIARIETCLLALEVNPFDIPTLNELFRYVHTIKGGAGFLGLQKIADLTHIMEDILSLAKSANLILEGHYIDTLLEAHDVLIQLIQQYADDTAIDIASLCQRLLNFKQPEIQEPPSKPNNTFIETAPIIIKTVIAPQESSIIVEKPIIEQDTLVSNHHSETEESIRVHVKRLNKLIDLAGELVLVRNQIFRVCEPLTPQTNGLKVILHNFNRITSEMQEEIMSTRMQPVGVIFNRFPRLIRQLEKDLNKQLELVTEGADVELDKTIIESLTDPVTHIIRNMADHGIENPQERLKKGKPPSGTLVQKAFHESGQVVIQFSDDGAGIDPEFIAAKALQKGIISQDMLEKMSAKEKMNLVFTAGFSTAETVSAVSGRGIGMDVVKTNIEACGGTIDINSELGKWTSITMTLPLTMAIISALIVSVQRCRFAFPQGNLEEMVLLEASDYANKVGIVQGQRMLCLRGKFIPLISLASSLNIALNNPAELLNAEDKPLFILIIKAERNRVAVIVDKILGSEEIVVKPMPDYFKNLKNFSGTSILGDGTIAMIIDVQGYIQNNQLAYTELQQESTPIMQRTVEQEPQSLLIFDNNTEEHFALALSWIRRIDTLETKRIQMITGNEYIEYRGEQVRLLRLENCLPVQKPNNYNSVATIIIPKRTNIPVALLINKVIDTKNTVIKLENTSMNTVGMLGSMLLDGKITLMLDLHAILTAGEPESVDKLVINTEKAKDKRVLLVEDTPFFMKVIKECVLSGGYQVTTATNGREGLELLTQQEFDLVLSDIEMPLMDGREMVKNIRANPRWHAMPVIALTTLNDEHTISEGKKAGFNEWLVKLDKELVLKTLAKYL